MRFQLARHGFSQLTAQRVHGPRNQLLIPGRFEVTTAPERRFLVLNGGEAIDVSLHLRFGVLSRHRTNLRQAGRERLVQVLRPGQQILKSHQAAGLSIVLH